MNNNLKYFQEEVIIKTSGQSMYEITDDINSWLKKQQINSGQLNIFIKHTSASLTINEDADPTVRLDFESHFNELVPENQSYYQHTFEGSDDMPAHLKASILGSSVQIPITKGKLNMGTWQGIYLCEHRNHAGSRKLVLTMWGE